MLRGQMVLESFQDFPQWCVALSLSQLLQVASDGQPCRFMEPERQLSAPQLPSDLLLLLLHLSCRVLQVDGPGEQPSPAAVCKLRAGHSLWLDCPGGFGESPVSVHSLLHGNPSG